MDGRHRKRGGFFSSGTAKDEKWGRGGKLAISSLAVTAFGAVVKDLSRPDSLIRGLIALGSQKIRRLLLPAPVANIGDIIEAEVIEEEIANQQLADNDK